MGQPMSTWGSKALVLPLILALGILGWFVLNLGGAGRGAGVRAEPVSLGQDVRASELSVSPNDETQSPAATGRRSFDEESPPQPLEPAALPVHSPRPVNGIAAFVLLENSDTPVPNAVVSWAPLQAPDGAERIERRALGEELSAVLERRGETFLADQEGVVWLPRSNHSALATCRHGDRWGFVEFRGDYQRVELRLFPDAKLSVRVVAAPGGAPLAGAQVAVHYQWRGESDILATRETNLAGLAEFDHVRQYGRHYWSHTEELSVRLSGLYEPPVGVTFDPWNPPGEPIELVLPPSATIEAEVLAQDGTRFEGPALVRVVQASADDKRPFSDQGRTIARPTVGGVATFRQIEPGVALRLRVETNDRHHCVPVAIRSPAADESERVHLELEQRLPVIEGRLVDTEGLPIASQPVISKLFSSTKTLYTDPEGHFRHALSFAINRPEPLTYELHLKAEDERDLVAMTELAGPLQSRTYDLGDLVLEASPVLVEGRVVDPDGRPIPGALLRVTYHDGKSHKRLTELDTFSREDGSFRIAGHAPAASLGLRARHPSFAGNPIETFRAGSKNVEIVMSSAGRLTGSLLLDEEWHTDFCQVMLRRAGENEWSEWGQMFRPGRFEFVALEPGVYTLRVATTTETAVGVDVEGIVVEAGETTRDSRLFGIDLRSKLKRIEVQVTSLDGTPIEEGVLHHRAVGAVEWDPESAEVSEGLGHVFTLLDEVDLFVEAERFRTAYLPGVREDQEVALDAGIPVRLIWKKPPPRKGNRRLSVRIAPLRGDDPELYASYSVHSKKKSKVQFFPKAGTYQVRYRVLEFDGSRRWNRILEQESSFDIRDQVDPQEIVLKAPEKVLELLEAP